MSHNPNDKPVKVYGGMKMKYRNEIGSYGWFREHGHGRAKALKRSTEFSCEGLIPFPRHGPREKQIDDGLENLDARLRYISRADYDPKSLPANSHSQEALIAGSYSTLSKQPAEYWNERTTTEFRRLEGRIRDLQQEGRLPHF